MLRLVLAAAVFLAAMSFDLRPAPAYSEGPWCSQVYFGGGEVERDCHYRSIEECRPNVIAGNRGFCVMNPRWNGPDGATEPRRRHAKRRARRH